MRTTNYLKSAVAMLMLSSIGYTAFPQQDTLFFEDFNSWPKETITDSIFYSYDEDMIPEYNGLPQQWFVSNFGNGGADTTESVALSSSWLENFASGNRNWLVLPALTPSAGSKLKWRSAPALGNLYMDGYQVIVATDPTILMFPYDGLIVDTLMSFAQNINNNENDFTQGVRHLKFDSAAGKDFGTGVLQYPGLLSPWEVDLSLYNGQAIYIAFLHDSDDDNYLALDDILVTGTISGVGVNEMIGNHSSSLFPNPTTGKSTLTFYLENQELVSWKIFDIMGKLVISKQFNLDEGSNTVLLDLEALPHGTYSVQLSASSFIVTRKLIKQ